MDSCNPITDCPGMYCGQTNLSNSSTLCFSSCQACLSGYRTDNSSSICTLCDDPANTRDYLYLIFMCLVTLVVRLGVTTFTNWYKLRSPLIIPLYVVPVIEIILSAIFTLLSLPPQGHIYFNSCSVNTVSDFYPIFFNPTVDYVNEIRCTYEVVYPLYRMVFIFFGIYFAIHFPVLVAVLIWSYIAWSREKREVWSPVTEYVWLISFPLLLLTHAVFSGLIYYSFDYITIIVAIGSFAVLSTLLHSYMFEDYQNPFKVYTLGLQWLLVIGSMLLIACGILSLTNWADIQTRSYFLPIVLVLPVVHPVLVHFASPQLLFLSWNVERMEDEYFEY